MSVLIKGMKMPKSCSYCRFCFEEDVMFETEWKCDLACKYFNDNDEGDRPRWCPLVDVPEPHGRLIDADAMVNLWKGCTFEGSVEPLLDTRPTVIEAEEEE